ncbi:MAG: ornithine carbamoyltransferase [Meiothermus sp.]|uniref:ornithine carbamoyltransferase n=1 Tax=Meiothermus sp. TaxID=1955249 RepID=UPI0025FC26E2|nr:ornithine carbamoyltransferase [Meiothermus sp.]MCS7057813.1 ornithine carbamoyltransferase [Meiothermus sp.]MCS7194657.1 ornithine carbamoyltransferase [Meiothermus sp.]MCX7740846.1 ornithine carbamoyltransferase [Meiothermus sp.]MDW8090934.1 ornithine carbamoyltransferase [Meiothermus sp.]MDW8481828.1 ornithine carbamoyltransferase [Meiothermus sp.]
MVKPPKPVAKGRDFLSNLDLSPAEYRAVLDTAHAMKRGEFKGLKPLEGQTLAMIFEKPSLRTRTTFEVAMNQLGGHAIHLTNAEIGLGTREPVRDIALNLERWVDAIMARVYLHSTLEELARYSSKPVINGLSDLLHPVQLLADYQTIEEHFGQTKGLRVTYIGDGNNMANAHIQCAVLSGVKLTVATPRGYEPNAVIYMEALRLGADVTLTHDPVAAVEGAQVLYTDVWVSMGQEAEASQRRKIKDFAGFQVTPETLERIDPDGIFLHCLPAHYGEEVVEEATLHRKSRVFDQAENRLHAQKALLYHLLG